MNCYRQISNYTHHPINFEHDPFEKPKISSCVVSKVSSSSPICCACGYCTWLRQLHTNVEDILLPALGLRSTNQKPLYATLFHGMDHKIVREYMPTVACKNALVSTYAWQKAPLFHSHMRPHKRARETDAELDVTCEEMKSHLGTSSGSESKHMEGGRETGSLW